MISLVFNIFLDINSNKSVSLIKRPHSTIVLKLKQNIWKYLRNAKAAHIGSSHPEVFYEKDVLKHFEKFTGSIYDGVLFE